MRRVDQRGTVIVQNFDAANRLTARTAIPALGEIVEGPFSESYVHDGLDRLVQGQSGTVITDFTYDSLSRRVSETTLGRTVTHDYDEVSNPVRLGYPSGVVIGQQFDALDRPSRIGPVVAGEIVDQVSYGYRGPHLLHEKRFGDALLQTWEYDAARRPVHSKTESTFDTYPVFEERLGWSPRDLKVAASLSLRKADDADDHAEKLVAPLVDPASPDQDSNAAALDCSARPNPSGFPQDVAHPTGFHGRDIRAAASR